VVTGWAAYPAPAAPKEDNNYQAEQQVSPKSA